MGFITSLLKSRQAFTSLSIIAGTIVGFLDGVYMPVGLLPDKVQSFLKVIPFGHSAVVFRNIIMSNSIDGVMGDLPKSAQEVYLKAYGVRYYVDNRELELKFSMIYMLIWTVVALFLYLVSSNYKRKKFS